EELKNMSTVANFAIVQNEGGRLVNRNIEFYNLDMVLSVGYRVKSDRGIPSILLSRWNYSTKPTIVSC
ncbi:MAG: virulence RhuM family protein, partial [Bacteroidaceae bacterium]|nr:virulence RhuM family protein [Bacteroidaceae bacterium]